MTASSLRNQSCKDLAQMARAVGLPGWHSMRKDELVRALVNHAKRKPKKMGAMSPATAVMARDRGVQPQELERLRQLRTQLIEGRHLLAGNSAEAKRDIQD